MKEMLHEKKLVKARAKKLYRKFRTFVFAATKWIGVLTMNRKRIKVNELCLKAYEKCRILSLGRIIERTVLTEGCEKFLTFTMLCKLMIQWNKTIIKIQRWARKCMEYKNIVYKGALDQWNRLENAISLRPTKKRGKSFKPRPVFIKDEVKIHQIRFFIKLQLKNYAKAQIIYKASLQEKRNFPATKPQPLNMLGSNFLHEISKQITSNTSVKRLSMRTEAYKIL
jgi:hypothetical protein